MSYIIRGLDPAPFNALADAGESALAEAHAIHVTADTATGYPCRVTLADAPEGTAMLLLPFTSHDAPTPYHTRYAIYVTEGATEAAQYDGQVPHMMARRTVALRGNAEHAGALRIEFVAQVERLLQRVDAGALRRLHRMQRLDG